MGEMDMHAFAEALSSKDLDRYAAFFADGVRLYTPIHEEPSLGKEAAVQLLQMVFSIFEDFHYPDVIVGKNSHALIFSAKVDGIQLQGVDYVKTDAGGRVEEFVVMIRPLNAVLALGNIISARMQAHT
jgi:hypothetical protein